MLIAGDYKGRLVNWDLRTSEVISISKAHDGKISSMAFSYDGTLFFTAGRDGLIKLWDASTFKLEAEGRNGSGIATISVSPVGDTFVTADRNGVISIWGVDPLRKLGEVCQYQSKASALAWSDNASRIATGSNIGDFDIWAISK
jgi:WD40 repeat protein